MISSNSARSATSTAPACSASRRGPSSSPWRRPTPPQACGIDVMDQRPEPAGGPAVTHEFFDRARARLSLDVPAGLADPNVPVIRGDLDLDPSLWERAGVAATRPAAVLGPGGRRPAAAAVLTHRTPGPSAPPPQIPLP